jgi:hypothetical protein
MSSPDYFSTAKYEPPPKKPRKPVPRGLIIAMLALVAVAALAVAGLKFGKSLVTFVAKEEKAFDISIPEAAVTAGTQWKWRTLAALPKAGKGSPRPEVVFADFTKDKRDDILLINFADSRTTIFQPDGKAAPVKGASWSNITRFYPWDFDRDGVAELIPHATVFSIVPTGGGWTRVPLPGG